MDVTKRERATRDSSKQINLRTYLEILLKYHPTIKTQKKLADRLGVLPTTVNNWLSHNTANPQILSKIAQGFGIEVQWFDDPPTLFTEKVKAAFSGASLLIQKARESSLIKVRVWGDDGKDGLIGQVRVEHFGFVPANGRPFEIPQGMRVGVELDFNEIYNQGIQPRFSEVLLFSEDVFENKRRTLCLRPSACSTKTVKEAQRTLTIPESDAERLFAENLGDMTLIAVLIPQIIFDQEAKLRDTIHALAELRFESCPLSLINDLAIQAKHATWLKRSLRITV